MKMDKLTIKQKAFADYYLETGNATEAAVRAGYSKRTASTIGNENLKKPAILAYIDSRMKAADSKRIADADEVLQYLSRVMRGEEKDQFGLDASLQDRTKAAELLGKRYRVFTENLNINNSAEDEKAKKMDAITEILKQMSAPEGADV